MRAIVTLIMPLMLALPTTLAAEDIAVTDMGSGGASYFSDEIAGQRTASGEICDPDTLTAAHRTLAFGSRVRVTNLANHQSVIVRINDRGPFHGGRIIDLSDAAAREIGMRQSGTAQVSLTLIGDSDAEPERQTDYDPGT